MDTSKTPGLPVIGSSWRIRLAATCTAAACVLLTLLTATTSAADDPYWRWAVAKFGHAIASDPAKQSTVWGENADPDRDGLRNLLEYTADTDPNSRTALSTVSTYSPTLGAAPASHPQLIAWQRTDDPDLRVLPQVSTDCQTWWPAPPLDLTQPMPPNTFVTAIETGASAAGLRQMRYQDTQTIAGRPAAFMRLLVIRRNAIAPGPGLEPFTFTSQSAVKTGSTARSNSIVLSGFTGTLTIAIPAGVTLFVNGVAQTGATALVKAGDTLWMQTTASNTAGLASNFTLTIGGTSSTCSFTTASIVPNHPGTDSGYSPIEAGVSETGAAQINIPIVVSPGTAGMQPKLSIGYSSQGGNGPLGLGFNLSGISAITRVARTVAQGGVKGGIAFDANDRYTFDGQRLIAIAGTDGADGTEYRLEFDPSTRIFSRGIEEGSAQRWTVETKAGLTMRFGAQTDRRTCSVG